MIDPKTSEIIEMAWADDISFEAIKAATGHNENAVIKIMRQHLKPASFRLWRKRVSGRTAKHREREMHHKRVTYLEITSDQP